MGPSGEQFFDEKNSLPLKGRRVVDPWRPFKKNLITCTVWVLEPSGEQFLNCYFVNSNIQLHVLYEHVVVQKLFRKSSCTSRRALVGQNGRGRDNGIRPPNEQKGPTPARLSSLLNSGQIERCNPNLAIWRPKWTKFRSLRMYTFSAF